MPSQYQRVECGHDEFMLLGERHRAGEIYMTGLERGSPGSKTRNFLWRVTYEILKP